MSVARSFRCGSLRVGTELVEIGAGVQQSANATNVMHHLGVRDTLRDVAYLPPVTEFRLFDNGEVLQACHWPKITRLAKAPPYLQMHRADLHRILL